ncbi:LTA synthase family protein [Solitalea canadensis]|uniref:Phosphoglycerol transferase family protein, alkaline phosphatase superfamily n=1 Tax=Solitalea canadensis (strain ATCC 29591 / DSM 3403 / JCM 21819 / LMG 8368 / NBRC 15130 / NCIMB 12057 / USAM 9D) TaxID=929556 RepID=H8KM35_SOLCM|nr:alkaline phosphatase family protein [Solitalea canadensis]AFD08957.1 phosphoglycerol transferase family protein, alkaline phosphatase superfamily [Solitalea canadensis DSM 3403]
MNYIRSSKAEGYNLYMALLLRLLVIMLLMSVCRVIFYLVNRSLFPIDSVGHFFELMAGGVKFDLAAVFYTNALYIVAFLLPFRFRYNTIYQNVLKWIFYVSNGIALAANCIDFIYFRFTLRRTTWTVFNEFSNDKGNSRLGLQFLIDYWYVVLIFIALVGVMVILYRKIIVRPTRIESNWIYYPTAVALLALGAGLFIGGVRGGFRHSTRPITLSNAGEYVNTPVEIGIVVNTPFSIYKTMSKRSLKKVNYFGSEKELESVYSPVHYPKPDSAFKKENVVIIILESFSKEFFGVYNKDLDGGTYKGYTPFLDSLVGESKTFKWSFATGKKSIDAMPSVLASIPSIVEPYVLSNYSGNKINSIASLLSKKGYDCSFFHGAPNGSMGFSSFAKLAGFQHYYGKTEYNNDDDFDGMWGIWDEPFFKFFATTLNQKQQPFMASIFSVSSHHPFKVPQQYEGKFPKGKEEIHQCVGYTDNALRKFFATASKMPWFKNTLFVITADHTSNQVTHDVYNTSVGSFAIPIIFYKPGSDLKGMDNKLFQQIDIMPSILGYLNYDEPYFAFGSDVLNTQNPEHIGINYTGVFQLYQGEYVLQSDDKGPIALFNYQKDPLLKNNELKTNNVEREKLEKYMKAFSQQYNNRMIDDRLTVQK